MTSVINPFKDKPRYFLKAGWTHTDLFGSELNAVCGFTIEGFFALQWGSIRLAANIWLQLVLDEVGLKGGCVLHLSTASVDFLGLAD